MNVTFKDYQEIQRYLNATICMYKGRPVYVRTIDGCLTNIEVYPVGKQMTQPEKIEVADDAFQTFPFELGLLNRADRSCVFLSRSGYRNSNYGLLVSSICVSKTNDEEYVESTTTLMQKKGYLDCLLNIYPSLEESIKQSSDTGHSRAFHKYYFVRPIEDGEQGLLGIFYADNRDPFAQYDPESRKFSIGARTKKNKAFFTIACKSGIIPSGSLET